MTERMALSKKVRFEVFKRDKFTCQYCGKAAPDVALEADHIHPVSKGGEDDLLNLVTSCRECNAGKSDRILSDDSVVQKQRRTLEELQDRREQIDMMLEWQQGLNVLQADAASGAADLWRELVPGYCLNDCGVRELAKTIRKYGLPLVLESMRTATEQYLAFAGGSAAPTQESVNLAWDYVGRICANQKRIERDPYMKGIWYAKGIIKKRTGYAPNFYDMRLMENACRNGTDPEEFVAAARQAPNISTFRSWLREIADAGASTEA
jgi:hypothetical protein